MAMPLQTAWGEPLLAPVRDRETEARVRREAGALPPWSRPFLPAPWVAKATVTLRPENALLVDLDFDLCDLLHLVISQENSCRYCYAVSRMLLRVQGMSEEKVQQLEQRLASAEFDPPRAAAVRFARRVTRASPLAGPADLAPLRAAGFSEGEVREIAFVAANVAFFNRINTFPAVPTAFWESVPDRWFVKLLRPLLGAMARRMNRRGSPAPAPSLPDPYGRLLAAYAGSPIGRVLAQALDEMWASDLLPRRSKALMFAVVGRSLGCATSLDAACRVLREEGMDERDVEQFLAHLGGSALDARERLLLDFARDSVWYDVPSIQRRTREVHAMLGLPAFVEALGVVSLANTVCRLGAVMAARP